MATNDPQFGEPIGLEDEPEEEGAPEEEEPGLGRRAAESGIDYGKKKGKELAQKKIAEKAGKKAAQKTGQAAGKAAGAAAGKGVGAAIGTAAGSVVPGLGNIVGFLAGTALGKIFSNKTIQKIVIGCSVLVIVGAIGIIFLFAALLFSTLRGNPSITGQSVHQGANIQSQEDIGLIGRLLGESRILTHEEVRNVQTKINAIKQNIENDLVAVKDKTESIQIIGHINEQLTIMEENSAEEQVVLAAQTKANQLLGSLKEQIKSGIINSGVNVIEFSSLGVRLNRVGPQSSHPFDNLEYAIVLRANDDFAKQKIADSALALVGSKTLPVGRRGEYVPGASKSYGEKVTVAGGGTKRINCIDFVLYAMGRAGLTIQTQGITSHTNQKANEFPLENGDVVYFNAPNHPAHPGPDSPWGHWVVIYKR